jgi:(S)-sulfolactate dehydrogenase
VADVVISEFMDEEAIRSLSTDFDVIYDPGLVDRRAELLATLPGVQALIVRNRTTVDAELLDANPGLRVVGRLGVGLDNIDLEACQERSVLVRPAIGANADAVAEYVIGAVLTLIRGTFLSTDRVLRGEWPRTEMVGLEVATRTLGLVGLGDIARRVAQRAAALGMRVRAYDPYLPADDSAWESIENVDLDTLIAHSDAISIHVPLTDATAGLFNKAVIESMKRTAVLVNTARGGIVDEGALVAALRDGRLRGAAIDVYEHEPVDVTTGERFKDVPNLILTPHIAGVTEESNVRVSSLIADLVRDALQGKAP